MPANDSFSSVERSMSGPVTKATAITADDGNELAEITRALSVNVTGDVKLTTSDGDTVVVTLTAGMLHPIRARKVFATGGTTATGIIGWR